MASTTHYLAISMSALLTGGVAACSWLGVPPLYHAPPLLRAKQWEDLYIRGRAVAPTGGLITASAFSYLSYQAYRRALPTAGFHSLTSKPSLYALGALCLIGFPVFTAITMEPASGVNGRMFTKLRQWKGKNEGEVTVSEAEDKEIKQILDQWIYLNYIRACLPATACGLAIAATWAL